MYNVIFKMILPCNCLSLYFQSYFKFLLKNFRNNTQDITNLCFLYDNYIGFWNPKKQSKYFQQFGKLTCHLSNFAK